MQKTIAAILLILILPLLALMCLLIIFIDMNPPVFIQERIGKHKVPFRIIKLTSMKNGKITLLGRVIRKTGLDELPQLINILKGDMAFVGPRPLTAYDIHRLNWQGERARDRWLVLPGITGPAQLVNVCDRDISLQNDLNYVQQKTAITDLKFVLYSLIIPFSGKQFVKNKIAGK